MSLKLKENVRIYEVSKKSGAQKIICENTDVINLTLEPTDAVLYRLQKADEAPFSIEYLLEK